MIRLDSRIKRQRGRGSLRNISRNLVVLTRGNYALPSEVLLNVTSDIMS